MNPPPWRVRSGKTSEVSVPRQEQVYFIMNLKLTFHFIRASIYIKMFRADFFSGKRDVEN